MSTQKDQTEIIRHGYNPFWVCLVVFAALSVDAGYRMTKLVIQRRQLDQAQLTQAQNLGRMSQLISQQAQVEAKLQALSFDLLQIARTNNTARQIVQEFNIQWTPPATNAPVVPTGK